MSSADGRRMVDEMYREHYSYIGGEYWRNHSVGDLNDNSKKGHSMRSHWNYYCLKRQSMDLPPLPPWNGFCVCHQPIMWNCYLLTPDGRDIVVVGNCCIKRFTDNQLRTCCVCSEPHRNRNYDLCNFHKEIHKKNETDKLKAVNQYWNTMKKCSMDRQCPEPEQVLDLRHYYGYYENMPTSQRLEAMNWSIHP